ncbi:hypothetical protein F4X90_21820 [Candidatus Poribacteria bacterium]|nr:hypothetical protein [Candidatus Poribacteria bacterium]
MAVVITPFTHQKILINTPFSLNIPISGNPTNAYISGRLLGLYSNWTGSRLELRGTPEKYAKNVDVTIIADSERYTGKISVVPPPPVISPLSRVTVSRGQEITIPIAISGLVSEFIVHGPWIGLKHRQTDTGGELYGIIDSSAEFTQRTFEYSITAYNQESFDTETLIVEIAVGG